MHQVFVFQIWSLHSHSWASRCNVFMLLACFFGSQSPTKNQLWTWEYVDGIKAMNIEKERYNYNDSRTNLPAPLLWIQIDFKYR